MNDKVVSQQRQNNAFLTIAKRNKNGRERNLRALTAIFATKNNSEINTYEKHSKKIKNDRLTQIKIGFIRKETERDKMRITVQKPKKKNIQ